MPSQSNKKKPWAKRRKTNKSWSPNGFYHTPEWRKFRNNWIQNNLLCVHCLEKGLIVEGDVVDHPIPIEDGGAKLSESNAQTLCHPCHNRKSINDRNKRYD